MRQATDHFEAQHPGLRLTGVPGPQANNSPVTTAAAILGMLSGHGPDVVADCCNAYAEYLAAGVAARLDGYLARDNLSTALWSRGHVQALTTPGGLYGLPVYDGPEVFAYRQDLLDQLGLAYPDPNWTYQDAERLFRQCAGTSQGRHRYGAALEWYTTFWGAPQYLLEGFGGVEMNPQGTHCLLGSPECVAAGEWIYSLLWDQIVCCRDQSSDWGGPVGLGYGNCVFQVAGGWDILPFTQQFSDRFKWDFMPLPVWPKGRATFINNDFWIMNAHAAHPEAAWEVLRWVAADPWYQRYMMRVQLEPPSLIGLWDEFVGVLGASAPLLRDKALHYYRDAVVAGYGVAEQFFRYEPSQADALIGTQIQNLWNRKTDVAAAFPQAARQVDALESEGAAASAQTSAYMAAAQAAIERAMAVRGAVAYPAPPRTGLGVQATSAARLVRLGPQAGTLTLRGAGGGGVGGVSDNGTMAAAVTASSRGDFVCRLASLAAPHAQTLAQGATVGLMARSNLADAAACVCIAVVVGTGVEFVQRPADGQPVQSDGPGLNSPGSIFLPSGGVTTPGLLAAGDVFAAKAPAGGNVLLKPVWLRFSLNVNEWMPYVSLDGRTWLPANPAGDPAPAVPFAGAWVGPFVSSASAGQYVTAVFDHISGFAPTTFVQIGRP